MDAAIQAHVRSAAAAGRATQRVGPFLATLDLRSAQPLLSYAIPEDGAEPDADDVAALREAYTSRQRVPRVEYLPAIAAGVEEALRAGGFAVEARLALMTCTPEEARELRPPEGVELILPRHDADLAAGVAVANEAFGEAEPPTREEVARTRSLLEAGSVAVLVRDPADGAAVGWGLCTPPRDGVTELVGIAVAASHRRRGVAGAITSRLAREAFDRGVTTAFLTPGDAGAERVYARPGCVARSHALHLRAG